MNQSWSAMWAEFDAAQSAAEASMQLDPETHEAAVALDAEEEVLFDRAYAAGRALLDARASSMAEFADKLTVALRLEMNPSVVNEIAREMREAA